MPVPFPRFVRSVLSPAIQRKTRPNQKTGGPWKEKEGKSLGSPSKSFILSPTGKLMDTNGKEMDREMHMFRTNKMGREEEEEDKRKQKFLRFGKDEIKMKEEQGGEFGEDLWGNKADRTESIPDGFFKMDEEVKEKKNEDVGVSEKADAITKIDVLETFLKAPRGKTGLFQNKQPKQSFLSQNATRMEVNSDKLVNPAAVEDKKQSVSLKSESHSPSAMNLFSMQTESLLSLVNPIITAKNSNEVKHAKDSRVLKDSEMRKQENERKEDLQQEIWRQQALKKDLEFIEASKSVEQNVSEAVEQDSLATGTISEKIEQQIDEENIKRAKLKMLSETVAENLRDLFADEKIVQTRMHSAL